MTSEDIKQWIRKESLMAQALRLAQLGWPEQRRGENLQPYWILKSELNVYDGCLLWKGGGVG